MISKKKRTVCDVMVWGAVIALILGPGLNLFAVLLGVLGYVLTTKWMLCPNCGTVLWKETLVQHKLVFACPHCGKQILVQ